MQFRYTGIHLSAPERVRYSYRLEGLDGEWVSSVARRVTNYNSLPHGQYRFTVRAELPDGPSSETSFAFELLPHFYETAWFRYFCAALGRRWAFGVLQFAAAADSPAILAGAGRARHGWRAKFTTRWRKASWESLRNWTPWRSCSTDTWTWRASIWIWRARWRATV